MHLFDIGIFGGAIDQTQDRYNHEQKRILLRLWLAVQRLQDGWDELKKYIWVLQFKYNIIIN
jgi:hypothetical protein